MTVNEVRTADWLLDEARERGRRVRELEQRRDATLARMEELQQQTPLLREWFDDLRLRLLGPDPEPDRTVTGRLYTSRQAGR